MEKRQIILNRVLNKPYPEGGFALDLGCGEGEFAFLLAKNGLSIHAVDSDPKAIKNLENRFEDDPDLIARVGDITDWPISEDTYTLIFARNVFPFIKDKEAVKKIITNAAEGLIPGGEFYFTLFGPEDGWSKKENMSFFEHDEIKPLLNELGLTIVDSDEFKGEGKMMNGNTKFWHIHSYLVRK